MTYPYRCHRVPPNCRYCRWWRPPPWTWRSEAIAWDPARSRYRKAPNYYYLKHKEKKMNQGFARWFIIQHKVESKQSLFFGHTGVGTYITETKWSSLDVMAIWNRVDRSWLSLGQVVTMTLLSEEFTRAQHRSHTRRVCECQLFLPSVLCDGISCPDQRSSFTLSFTPSKISLSQFSRNKH